MDDVVETISKNSTAFIAVCGAGTIFLKGVINVWRWSNHVGKVMDGLNTINQNLESLRRLGDDRFIVLQNIEQRVVRLEEQNHKNGGSTMRDGIDAILAILREKEKKAPE